MTSEKLWAITKSIKFSFSGKTYLLGFKLTQKWSTITSEKGKFCVPVGVLIEKQEDQQEFNVVLVSFVFFWFTFLFGYTYGEKQNG